MVENIPDFPVTQPTAGVHVEHRYTLAYSFLIKKKGILFIKTGLTHIVYKLHKCSLCMCAANSLVLLIKTNFNYLNMVCLFWNMNRCSHDTIF
jgi:hypothetical protein